MGRCSEGDKHDTYYIDFKDQTGALKHTLATREHRTMHDIKTFSVGYYSGGSLTVDDGKRKFLSRRRHTSSTSTDRVNQPEIHLNTQAPLPGSL